MTRDEDTGPEHVQPPEASDLELLSPRNGTAQAFFETQADRDHGDGESYTIETPKGAMRFLVRIGSPTIVPQWSHGWLLILPTTPGASSHFLIVSPEGVGWLESKTGNNVWRHVVQRNSSRWRLADWYPRTLQDNFQSRCSQPLPSKAVILDLVHEYFDTFNKALPLFGPESFMAMVSRHFSWNPNESPSWRACIKYCPCLCIHAKGREFRCQQRRLAKMLGSCQKRNERGHRVVHANLRSPRC